MQKVITIYNIPSKSIGITYNSQSLIFYIDFTYVCS